MPRTDKQFLRSIKKYEDSMLLKLSCEEYIKRTEKLAKETSAIEVQNKYKKNITLAKKALKERK